MNINVAIIDDDKEHRQLLEQVINGAPGFRCLCECGSAEEALSLIPKLELDIVLSDITLPNLSGIECVERIQKLRPQLPVIMLTACVEEEKIFKAFKAGAIGYLLKQTSPARLMEAIKDALNGGAPMTAEIARLVVTSFKPSATRKEADASLTRREQEILSLLSKGHSNKEIAASLSVSFDTVRTHLRHIYERMNVRSRTGAVAWYLNASNRNVAAPSNP